MIPDAPGRARRALARRAAAGSRLPGSARRAVGGGREIAALQRVANERFDFVYPLGSRRANLAVGGHEDRRGGATNLVGIRHLDRLLQQQVLEPVLPDEILVCLRGTAA